MVFLKKWKTNWELKSLTFKELFNIIVEIIAKQLEEIEKEDIKLDKNLIIDFESDSVDIVAMLLNLEDIFKNTSENTRIIVPTDKLGKIVLVEDIVDIMYEVLLNIENKMTIFTEIKPNLSILEKRQKIGELYSKI